MQSTVGGCALNEGDQLEKPEPAIKSRRGNIQLREYKHGGRETSSI